MREGLVLVDTSIWIEALDKGVEPKLKGEMEILLLEQRVAVTPLIKLELLGGASNEVDYEKLKQDLEALPQLDFAPEVWDRAYQLSFRLRRAGLSLPNTDILLAAVALHYKCRLWHRDRHFELIAKHIHLPIHQP